MNKKKYEKPTTQVVVLHQQTALLQASGTHGFGDRPEYILDDENPFAQP